MENVTQKLLRDTGIGTGPQAKRLLRAAPAKAIDAKLGAVIEYLRDPRRDVTMGFISAPLLYSKFIHSLKTDQQSAVYRLIKGGFLIIVRHDASPPIPSFAHMDNSHAKVYYELAMNPEKF